MVRLVSSSRPPPPRGFRLWAAGSPPLDGTRTDRQIAQVRWRARPLLALARGGLLRQRQRQEIDEGPNSRRELVTLRIRGVDIGIGIHLGRSREWNDERIMDEVIMPWVASTFAR